MKAPRTIACLPLLLLSAGCHDSATLGVEPPDWKADCETGDLSQWSQDGNGGTFASDNAALSLVTAPVHRGHYAMKSSINAAGNLSFARAYRQDNLPAQAFYGVWFYIPEDYTVTGIYWNLLEFSGRNPSNPNASIALWSLNLHQGADGKSVWYVWDGLRSQEVKPAIPVSPPIGRWFHVLAFIQQATDETGRAAFWIDDVPFIDQRGVSTVPSNWMSWAIGGVSEEIAQHHADLYIDDAMIWRGAPR